MPFVSSREMLCKAQAGGYAVGAFNAENLEMAQAIIAAAEAENAPVMIQTTPGTLKYAGPECFSGLVGRLARDAKVPAALHLDHGNSYELAEKCARVLADAGVYKHTPEGDTGVVRFLENLGYRR